MKNIRIRQVEPKCTPIHRTFAPPAPVSLLDPLICFCRAHGRDKQTDMRSNRPNLYAVHSLRCVLKITANAKIGGISSGDNMNGTKLVVN